MDNIDSEDTYILEAKPYVQITMAEILSVESRRQEMWVLFHMSKKAAKNSVNVPNWVLVKYDHATGIRPPYTTSLKMN